MHRDGVKVAKHAGRAALVVALLVVGQPAGAADTGDEWQALAADKARIVFQAPGLEDQRVRYLRGQPENNSATQELAVWTGAAARQAKAVVVYNKLSPGYHYRVRSDPKKVIKGFETFADKELEFGKYRSTGNPAGRIEFRRFGFENMQCVGFIEYWGADLGGESTSVGTRLMYGYYCADPGEALADEAVTAVVKGLDVKD